jgi:hypothetical protein
VDLTKNEIAFIVAILKRDLLTNAPADPRWWEFAQEIIDKLNESREGMEVG